MENSLPVSNPNLNSNCTNGTDSYNLNQNNSNGHQSSNPQYNFPAILHYLQYQWQKFEQDRLQWDIEKAEMKTQLRILEGRIIAQFNLKKDLIRRIKMLEFCLREERAKYHQLKYGVEPPPLETNKEKKNEEILEDNSHLEITTMSNWEQGRKLLRQYLLEIGYTDTIIDVRSNRVRYLLGLGNNEEISNENNQNANNVDPNSLIDKQSSFIEQITNKQNEKTNNYQNHSSSTLVADAEASVSATFEFLNEHTNSMQNLDKDDQNEDNDYEYEYEDIHEFSLLRSSQLRNKNYQENNTNVVQNATTTENKSNYDLVDYGELANITPNNENYENQDNINDKDNTNGNNETIKVFWNPHYLLRSHYDCIRCLKFHPKEPLVVTGSEDETIKLWNLKKASLNSTKKQPVSGTIDLEPIYTYRGHKSPVLSLIISGNKIYSGDADGEILIWKIPEKYTKLDPFEPFDVSFYPEYLSGHTNAVWSLVMMPTKKALTQVCSETNNITNENNEIKEEDVNSDEIEEGTIMCSASSDGTIKIWNVEDKVCCKTIVLPETNNRPTCLVSIPDETSLVLSEKIKNTNPSPSYLVASFTNGSILIYDIDSSNYSTPILVFETSDNSFRVNAIVIHPFLPVLVSAHENKLIKFWDYLTGKCFFSTIAHLDEVTCLDCDSKGLYLLSGGHDCSVRLWNFHTKKCIKEITSHRNKFSEALLCVSFHPTQKYFASGGADTLAKIFS